MDKKIEHQTTYQRALAKAFGGGNGVKTELAEEKKKYKTENIRIRSFDKTRPEDMDTDEIW